jgi:hypothetical protein
MYTFESKAQCRFLAPFIPFDNPSTRLRTRLRTSFGVKPPCHSNHPINHTFG